MKGDITINVIITGLFAITVSAFLVFILFKTFTEIQTANYQSQSERNAINLANALISNEKIVYEKDGIKYRGILNASKLNETFLFSENGFRNKDSFRLIFDPNSWITKEKLNLGYPNAFSLVFILDIDDCSEEKCVAWGGLLSPRLSISDLIESNPRYKFGKCLFESFDVSWGHAERMGSSCILGGGAGAAIGAWVLGIGAPIGAAIGCAVGILATLWTPEEISNCVNKAMPEFIKNWFETGSPISNKGLPVNIIYDNGKIHVGRVIVSLIEWY